MMVITFQDQNPNLSIAISCQHQGAYYFRIANELPKYKTQYKYYIQKASEYYALARFYMCIEGRVE